MGIHIIPKILKHKISLDSYPPQTYWETEKFNSFDSIRCSGDTDFIFESNIEWIFEHDDPDHPEHEHSFRRPKDIDKAICWVKNNIPDSNKNRLFNLLNSMKIDSDLWIKVSY